MRVLAVVLLLSVPLAADEVSSLRSAVKLFRSQDAAQRTLGSQRVDRELRRLLAPLLEALRDEDPEVRRRARRAILSLVPGELEKLAKEKKAAQPVFIRVIGLQGGVGQAFRGRAGHRAFRAVVAKSESPSPTQKQRLALRRIGTRLLPNLGVHWKARWKAPLMPGFMVHKVKPESAAALLGLRQGDLIVRIDGVDVAALRVASVDWSRVGVTVYRDGRYVRLLPRPDK